MANFGLGVGAFAKGLTEGMTAMQGLKRAQTQQEVADMQLQDLKDERAQKQGYKDLAAQGMSEAKANTDGQLDSVTAYYMKNTAPKLQQYWLSQGDVQKADAFGKWIQDSNVQQGMKYSAGFMRAAQIGDAEGAMNNLVKMYNQPGYFEDGMSAVNAKLLRDKQGNNAGMQITLRNDKTGEETTQTFNSMTDVYKLGMQFAAPDAVFSYGMKQLEAGQAAAAASAKEQREWQRDNLKAERDQGYKLEGQNNASQLRMAEEAEKQRSGLGSKVRRDANAKISRVDDYIKRQSEADRNFRKLPQDEQIAQAMEYIKRVDSATGDSTSPGLGVPQGQQTQTEAQPQGDIYFDTKTGQLITR